MIFKFAQKVVDLRQISSQFCRYNEIRRSMSLFGLRYLYCAKVPFELNAELAKSIHDAGWGQFLQILSVKAASAGQGAIAVNPNGTSQECSGCGAHVPKTLADRWHSCPHCGLEMDRDENAARNIKLKAVGHPVSARGGQVNGQPKNREARVA
jgi:transposase